MQIVSGFWRFDLNEFLTSFRTSKIADIGDFNRLAENIWKLLQTKFSEILIFKSQLFWYLNANPTKPFS
jgi:hypothetical protein